MEVEFAIDVQGKLERIVDVLGLAHLDSHRIICMRSRRSRANAYARVWNLPRIWQRALGVGAYYVIEVLGEHFDKLSEEEKEKVLIHELMHIPKSFSGALVPHECFGRTIDNKSVERMHTEYKRRLANEVDR